MNPGPAEKFFKSEEKSLFNDVRASLKFLRVLIIFDIVLKLPEVVLPNSTSSLGLLRAFLGNDSKKTYG
jgi:hypothetical protein